MTLQNIINQIVLKTATANDDLKDATNATRAMRQGNKRAAESQLEDLKNEYRRSLLSGSTFVIVTGAGSKDLVDLANADNKSFGTDSEDLYQKIVAKLDERSYMGKSVANSVFNDLSGSLREVAQEIGIRTYPQMHFKAEYAETITSEEQLVKLTKRAVNDHLGSEMVGINAISSILENAILRGHAETYTPVLLNTKDDKLAVTLSNDLKKLSRNVFVVSVGKTTKVIKSIPNSLSVDEASPEVLGELLQAIKEKSV